MGIDDLVKELLERYKAALGNSNLADTASYQITYNGKEFAVDFVLQDYWYYLENGRKAGRFPPIEDIEEWIKAKPIIPRTNNGKVPTTKQLAFLISRKIAKEGTKPSKVLQKTLERNENLINAIVDELTNQIINELNKEIENEIS